ncbi:hypothetical protein D3C76_1852020 [compost metagenome]
MTGQSKTIAQALRYTPGVNSEIAGRSLLPTSWPFLDAVGITGVIKNMALPVAVARITD